MDPLDRLARDQSLLSFGVTATTGKDFYFVSPHPMDEFLLAVSARLPQPIDLLVSEQGAPEHFFLSGLDFLPVVFSSRYIALSERVMRLGQDMFRDSQLRRTMAEGVAYDVIAEFCLLERNLPGAAAFFMKARMASGNILLVDSRSFFGAGSDLLGMEAGPVDEHYVTGLFFGLAHEMGHAIQASEPADAISPPWCTDELILRYVEAGAHRSAGDAGLTFRAVGPSAALDIRRLRSESGADIEGCRLLARAARPIIEKHGEAGADVDVRELFTGFLSNFLLMGFIGGCRRVAKMIPLGPNDQEKIVEYLQQPIAFAVRQMILIDHLPIIAADLFGSDVDGARLIFGDGPYDVALIDPIPAQYYKAIWDSAFRGTDELAVDIDAGLCGAIDFFNRGFPQAEMNQMIADYRARLDHGDVDMAIERFIGLARSMRLPQADLDELNGALRFEPTVPGDVD